MKKALLLFTFFSVFIVLSCSHKYYAMSFFDQQTANHKVVAVLPAEMIFTGKQPENLAPEDITKIEESESKSFQYSLYNSILSHANSKKYFTRINLQDIVMTQKLLEEHNISPRDTWKKDDKELAAILGVDAVVRMRIQKQRYMSDVASYGISVGRQIVYNTGLGSKIPLPYIPNKTNDIYARCNIVSNNQTLWNDNYKGASNWNTPSNIVIENITDNFGRHFPYKQRR
jgi:hypothetical protein